MGKSRFQAPGARGWGLRTEGWVPSGRGHAGIQVRFQVRCGSDHRTPAIGESEVRVKSICFPLSAFRLLLTAYCVSGLYYVPEGSYGVYTLGYDAISELKSRRNQL